jgi:hypothetical protein
VTDHDAEPGLTWINLHVRATNRLEARQAPCHRVAIQIGDRTELTLFLDASARDRLTAVLDQAWELLRAPSQPAAAWPAPNPKKRRCRAVTPKNPTIRWRPRGRPTDGGILTAQTKPKRNSRPVDQHHSWINNHVRFRRYSPNSMKVGVRPRPAGR